MHAAYLYISVEEAKNFVSSDEEKTAERLY
jgi:hypothetical protein